MKKNKVVAFVPIRLNSKRIVGKNLKEIGGQPLLSHIFNTLLASELINEVYAYCSSDAIKEHLPEGVVFLKRDKRLDDDLTLGKEIYEAFYNDVAADIYVLAHTTSPFLKVNSINLALHKVIDEDYDSAMSVQKIQTFVWHQGKPLNYRLDIIPRTQDLEPVYVESSGFFIYKKDVWGEKKQRIGDKPFFQVVSNIEAIDIDHPEDFEIAEIIAKKQ